MRKILNRISVVTLVMSISSVLGK